MFGYTFTSNPEKISRKAEQQIQNELGITDTIPYEIEKDVPGLRYVLRCKIPGARQVDLSFYVKRTNLFYTNFFVMNFTSSLSSQVLGRVSYDFAKYRKSKKKATATEYDDFMMENIVEGDMGTREKLKKAGVLQKLIHTCASYGEYGTIKITYDPSFEIVPSANGSQLSITTLMRIKKKKIIAAPETEIGLQELIKLADDVDRALSHSKEQTMPFEKPNYSIETELDINS